MWGTILHQKSHPDLLPPNENGPNYSNLTVLELCLAAPRHPVGQHMRRFTLPGTLDHSFDWWKSQHHQPLLHNGKMPKPLFKIHFSSHRREKTRSSMAKRSVHVPNLEKCHCPFCQPPLDVFQLPKNQKAQGDEQLAVICMPLPFALQIWQKSAYRYVMRTLHEFVYSLGS